LYNDKPIIQSIVFAAPSYTEFKPSDRRRASYTGAALIKGRFIGGGGAGFFAREGGGGGGAFLCAGKLFSVLELVRLDTELPNGDARGSSQPLSERSETLPLW
jgi:hypothetical protein